MSAVSVRLVPSSGGGSLVASRIISSVPCKVLSFLVFNSNASLQYLQVHASATLPANGAVPVMPAIPIGANAITMIDFGTNGVDLDACVVCNSSTPTTKTIGAADCAISATLLG